MYCQILNECRVAVTYYKFIMWYASWNSVDYIWLIVWTDRLWLRVHGVVVNSGMVTIVLYVMKGLVSFDTSPLNAKILTLNDHLFMFRHFQPSVRTRLECHQMLLYVYIMKR